jgi:hypothetical protein
LAVKIRVILAVAAHFAVVTMTVGDPRSSPARTIRSLIFL